MKTKYAQVILFYESSPILLRYFNIFWILINKCTCFNTEIQVAGQIFYLTQSQYTDTGPTSPSSDPITPGEWHGSHRSTNF